MQLITYQSRLAALAGTDRVYLAAHLDRLPTAHPDKQFVLRLALYAHQLERCELPGEPLRYLPGRAHRYVRDQTMPAREFRACAHLSDHDLADIFNAPLDQVTKRRQDLCQAARRRSTRHRAR